MSDDELKKLAQDLRNIVAILNQEGFNVSSESLKRCDTNYFENEITISRQQRI